MTFDDARKIHLGRFDSAVVEIRKIIADPGWCNTKSRALTEAQSKANDAMNSLAILNETNIKAERTFDGDTPGPRP